MPDPFSIFSSPGAETVITLLTPHKAPQGSLVFPKNGLLEADMRVTDSESVHEWFRRLIGSTSSDERIDDCAINSNFAFLGSVHWDKSWITRCSFQALVTTDDSLSKFYNDGRVKSFYYRLDFDPHQPGPLFREPQPHVHCTPSGPPWFPFFCVQGEYVLISFLEFIFLNYFHNDWLSWAEQQSRRLVTPDAFAAIVESYKTGPLTRLGQLAPDLQKLKRALSEVKQKRSPHVYELLPARSTLSNFHGATHALGYEGELTKDE